MAPVSSFRDLPVYLTRDEAATYARCSVRTIDRWFASGRLRVVGEHGFRRTRPEWIDSALAAGSDTGADVEDERRTG